MIGTSLVMYLPISFKLFKGWQQLQGISNLKNNYQKLINKTYMKKWKISVNSYMPSFAKILTSGFILEFYIVLINKSALPHCSIIDNSHRFSISLSLRKVLDSKPWFAAMLLQYILVQMQCKYFFIIFFSSKEERGLFIIWLYIFIIPCLLPPLLPKKLLTWHSPVNTMNMLAIAPAEHVMKMGSARPDSVIAVILFDHQYY